MQPDEERPEQQDKNQGNAKGGFVERASVEAVKKKRINEGKDISPLLNSKKLLEHGAMLETQVGKWKMYLYETTCTCGIKCNKSSIRSLGDNNRRPDLQSEVRKHL